MKKEVRSPTSLCCCHGRQESEARHEKHKKAKRLFSVIWLLFCVLCLLSLFACSSQSSPPEQKSDEQHYNPRTLNASPIIISLLPVERAGAMYERFVPLKYYLENVLKRPITITVAKDYEDAIYEIGSGKVHMAFLDPAVYCEVRARYRNKVVPLIRTIGKDGATSRSVLVVKDKGGIDKAADVKGKRLALGSKQSSFSYLIPLSMLNDVSLRVNDFAGVDFLEKEDRVALSVLIGDHDVGALSEAVAAKYIKDGLKIIKRSEAIPSFVLCASDTLSHEIQREVIRRLSELQDAAILSSIDKDIAGFAQAEDRDFDVIRMMIKNLTGKDYIEYGQKTVKVAILPLYSAITLYDRYDPLMRYLSQKTGYKFKLVIPKNFEDFMHIVKSGKVDFSYQNPYIFALIDREVDIKPLVTTIGEDNLSDDLMGGSDKFRGVIITRQDSMIKDIKDLRNKKVLITSPKSAGGYLSQRIFLMDYAIDTEKDMKIIDAKRQENVILGVYRGEADAGFVRESALVAWNDVVDMKKIRILAKTKQLPNWPFAQCRNINHSLASEVRHLLIELNDREILKAAKIRGFRAASDDEFEELKKY
jgi:phosphate/phosphite/phosphonate ABC transporter binding protein